MFFPQRKETSHLGQGGPVVGRVLVRAFAVNRGVQAELQGVLGRQDLHEFPDDLHQREPDDVGVRGGADGGGELLAELLA